jgi:hypothetical protein
MSKEAYASALEEQIASRKFQGATELDENTMPFLHDDDRPVRERAMGTRVGGPMAPTCKENYASDLRAQIAARDAQRLAECEAREIEVGGLDAITSQLGQNNPQVAALGGRSRRHGAPTLPSKESYATELREQMVQRNAKQATEAFDLPETPAGDEDAIDAVLLGKGRRKAGPMVLPPKDSYAAELRDQMSIDNAKRVADRDHLLAVAPEGPSGVFAGQVELNRGKRPAAKIDQVSRTSLGTALQEQMDEKASLRAEKAHHVQIGDSKVPGVEATLEGQHRGRKKVDQPATNKKAYAQALQEQMAQRDNAKNSDEVFHTAFVGGAATDNGPQRGRRHQQPAFSKTELRVDLQRQMAEREAQRNDHCFHRKAAPPLQATLLGTEGCSSYVEQELPIHMATGSHGDSLERLLSEHAVGAVC